MSSRICPSGSSKSTPRPPSWRLISPARRLPGSAQSLSPSLADAGNALVEVVFAYQEGGVLGAYLAVDLVEVESGRSRQAQDLREACRRLLLVAAPDDGVVELHTHVTILLSWPTGMSSIVVWPVMHLPKRARIRESTLSGRPPGRESAPGSRFMRITRKTFAPMDPAAAV